MAAIKCPNCGKCFIPFDTQVYCPFCGGRLSENNWDKADLPEGFEGLFGSGNK